MRQDSLQKSSPLSKVYSHIGIIYNPKSTGAAPQKAKQLNQELSARVQDVPISLQQTERAKHAEELAYELAAHHKQPLIISVSGDGGYNEVINGALRAAEEHGSQPICAVHGAGNANDHRRTLQERPLAEAVIHGKIRSIDLLKVAIKRTSNKKVVRYAHSYVGLGLTPAVAVELNKHKLNRWRETVLVAQTFWRYEPFAIEVDGKCDEFDSLVFANINQMAKVVKLSADGRPDDGYFEIIEIPHSHRLSLLMTAARSALFGLGKQPRRQTYGFKVIKDLPMQLDGELTQLQKNDMVDVSIAPRALRTIL